MKSVFTPYGTLFVIIFSMVLSGLAWGNPKGLKIEFNQFQQEEKIAILVGVEKYPVDSGLRKLDYAVGDAHALADYFKQAGYKVRSPKTDQHALRSHILNEIDLAGRRLPKGRGTLVFSFSGHGFAERGENYLATYDAIADNLPGTGLSLTKLQQALKATGARRIMVFIDACRNAPLGGKSFATRSFNPIKDSEGMQILFSTRSNGRSWEHGSLKHGVFTYFLLKGLNGNGARRVDGLITFSSLAQYVEKSVSDYSYEHLNGDQDPFRAGEARGTFVLSGQMQELPKDQNNSVIINSSVSKSKTGGGSHKFTPTNRRDREVFQDTLLDGGQGPEMVVIPSGSFRMGCLSNDSDCQGDEKPVRKVSVAQFAMGRYEVTVGDYFKCVDAGGCAPPEWRELGSKYNIDTGSSNIYKRLGSALTDSKHPIVGVSWFDAVTYTQWLSRQTGKVYRLPTEAEWEYAVRAGSETKYPWGDYLGKNRANCSGDNCGDQHKYTSSVGSFKANDFKLFDTVGNVWEWTCSLYEKKYSGKELQCLGKKDARSSRVLRGGSWGNEPWGLRSAFRGRGRPDYRGGTNGFRLAQDLSL